MKNNAQKILLCLYSFSKSDRVLVTPSKLKLAVPDMTDGGYRSLLLFLQRKELLIKESLPERQYFSLTDKGREALKSKFPALNPKWQTWQGEWHAMTFLRAPASDSQFRYLRQLLITDHAMPLTRGVYLAAGGFSSQIVDICSSLYQENVVIFSVKEWEFGLDRPIIVKYYDLASVASVYSSISNSLEELLEIFKKSKSTSNQQKMRISTTIDRLWSGLTEDPGFTTYYFPGLLDLNNIFQKTHQLLQL